ncbi:MAG: DUF2442 domain-containing protein [Acidimicrobiia bacterium]
MKRENKRVEAVEHIDGFVVRLKFSDGVTREVDLKQYFRGPIFEELLRDEKIFRQVRVDEELGVIVWPNGADLDADVLYGLHAPAWKGTEVS